jgi:hypothetical protein
MTLRDVFETVTVKELLTLFLFLVIIPSAVFFCLRKYKPQQRIGLTLSITLIVFVIAAFAVPNLIQTRMVVSQNACVNNLHWIQEAKKHWAGANHKSMQDVPTAADIFNETNGLRVTQMPDCPAGGTYIIGAVGEEAKCSIGPPQHTLHPSNLIYVVP